MSAQIDLIGMLFQTMRDGLAAAQIGGYSASIAKLSAGLLRWMGVHRITRLVDDLQSRGFVSKRRSADDGRGNVASLTDKGLAKLEEAYPEHLESARNRVTDHVSPSDVRRVSRSLANIADHLED